MLDSEPIVKASYRGPHASDSESMTSIRANVLNVAKNRDTVLSDYIRSRIRQWVEVEGREQKDLAHAAGFPSPSTVAMVKKGQGIGEKTAPGWARAFGFKSVEAMVDAAYEWRRGLGESLERRLADDAFQQGATMLSSLMPEPTDAELRTIASDFVSARFDGRDPMWWLNTLGAELQRDRARERAQEAEKNRLTLERDRTRRTEEAAWRSAARLKQQLAANTLPSAQLPALPAHEDPAAESEKPRRRKRARAG